MYSSQRRQFSTYVCVRVCVFTLPVWLWRCVGSTVSSGAGRCPGVRGARALTRLQSRCGGLRGAAAGVW